MVMGRRRPQTMIIKRWPPHVKSVISTASRRPPPEDVRGSHDPHTTSTSPLAHSQVAGQVRRHRAEGNDYGPGPQRQDHCHARPARPRLHRQLTAMTSVSELTVASLWQQVQTGDDTVAVTERDALGSSALVAVWPPGSLGAACAAVDGALERVDRQASRFRDDSEISWVHRCGGGLFMLSDGLAEAVGVALTAARWTRGRTDPTVCDALVALATTVTSRPSTTGAATPPPRRSRLRD